MDPNGGFTTVMSRTTGEEWREMQDAEQAFEDARQHLPHGCMMP